MYEGASHPTRARYQYWAKDGLAGCVLRPHLRTKENLNPMVPADTAALLFPTLS